MKRSELKVGEHYAVYHPTENPLWRNIARVEVLHVEPWREEPRTMLSHSPVRLEPTPGGKGRGVHVRVIEGYVRGHPTVGKDGDETVVPTSMIRSTWADYEEAERERERQEAVDKDRQTAMNAEWQDRVDAVLGALVERTGIDLDLYAPRVHTDGSHATHWRLPMATMESIVEVIKKGSS